MASYCGVRIKMNVRVVDDVTKIVLLPTEEFEIVVQPPPYCYDRFQVLAIQAESMAKIKYVNNMYSRMIHERDISNRLRSRKWTVDAIVTSQELIPDHVPA